MTIHNMHIDKKMTIIISGIALLSFILGGVLGGAAASFVQHERGRNYENHERKMGRNHEEERDGMRGGMDNDILKNGSTSDSIMKGDTDMMDGTTTEQ